MRYIRTKDGRIVDTTKYPEHPASWGVQASDYALTIKQADTIEELCDEFVIHRIENDYTFVWNKERNVGFTYFCSFPEKYDVYGAVWTSKGLIYVAKMDSEGKLVLI